RTLNYPVYLPILAPRAEDACERALEAMGHMATPEATKALVTLLEHKNAAFAQNVLKVLNGRLPDPRLEEKREGPGSFDADFLAKRRWWVEGSGRAEFAPAVRKVGRKLLESKDIETVSSAAYIVECLGGAEELPGLVKALNHAADEASKQKRESN